MSATLWHDLAVAWLPVTELLRNVMLGLAAGIGLWLAWRRVRAANRQSDAAIRQSEIALQQSDLARRAHVSELFNKAVEQLVSERMEMRLGAIFTLRQISNDFKDLADPTFQLLGAYLRYHPSAYNAGQHETPPDVAEIIETLKDRIKAP
jgi:hypothetical protein